MTSGEVLDWRRVIGLYGRARGVWITALLVGPALVLLCALAPRTIPLLLSDGDQRLRLPAVIGLTVVIAVGPGLARNVSEVEWLSRGVLRSARVVHLMVCAALLVVVGDAVAGTVHPDRLALEITLNGLALLGLALLTITLTAMPPWVLVLVLVAVTYVIGTDADTGRPHRWAWLLWTDHFAGKAL
ncbi:MAG: hypothetical protein ACTHMS_20635, partial [Jatrophihabitans sp.]|uniref:hypothetical protein n=1 Tax=Jatrophihabitans sp. TaxID=1932789 RepID=UPI003F821989